MNLLLLAGFAIIAVTFWRAHVKPGTFNAFDLIMENGRVSKIAFAFMLVLAVSTWVIVDLQMKGKLDSGMYLPWLAAWVTPLVAKVVFNKNDVASMTVATTTMTVSEVTPPPAPAAPAP